ncbi:hypothetical protein ABKV19_007344, partial [Rosa sericea]
ILSLSLKGPCHWHLISSMTLWRLVKNCRHDSVSVSYPILASYSSCFLSRIGMVLFILLFTNPLAAYGVDIQLGMAIDSIKEVTLEWQVKTRNVWDATAADPKLLVFLKSYRNFLHTESGSEAVVDSENVVAAVNVSTWSTK